MKVKAFKVGGFIEWFRLITKGKPGEFSFSKEGISFKNTYSLQDVLFFYWIPVRFNHELSEITEISESKYFRFYIIPFRCLVLNRKKGKPFKFCFKSKKSRNNFLTFCNENNIKTPDNVRGGVAMWTFDDAVEAAEKVTIKAELERLEKAKKRLEEE